MNAVDAALEEKELHMRIEKNDLQILRAQSAHPTPYQ